MIVKIVEIGKHDRDNSERDYNSRPRMYVSLCGSNPIYDMKSGERWNRPHREIRKHFPAIFKQLGLPENTKGKWSQKAGCRCGCSPGFILDCNGHFDIWITYSYEK